MDGSKGIATTRITAALLLAVALATAPPAAADLIECPDHSHVWNATQCPDATSPFGFPGATPSGGAGGGSGGLLGLVHTLTGGLL